MFLLAHLFCPSEWYALLVYLKDILNFAITIIIFLITNGKIFLAFKISQRSKLKCFLSQLKTRKMQFKAIICRQETCAPDARKRHFRVCELLILMAEAPGPHPHQGFAPSMLTILAFDHETRTYFTL